MANTATELSTVPGGYSGCGGGSKITPVVVSFDTTDTDLTVYTPASGKRWAIVGLQYNEGSAHSLIIKSEDTAVMELEYSANSGVHHALGAGFFATGLAAGDVLKMQSKTGAITNATVWVQEIERVRLG